MANKPHPLLGVRDGGGDSFVGRLWDDEAGGPVPPPPPAPPVSIADLAEKEEGDPSVGVLVVSVAKAALRRLIRKLNS